MGPADDRCCSRSYITPAFWANGLGFRVVHEIDAARTLHAAPSGVSKTDSSPQRMPKPRASSDGVAKTGVDPDRRAAKAILALGGSVTIWVNNEWREVQPGQALPDEAFSLTRIELRDKPALKDGDLEPLEGVANLGDVRLSDLPNVTDAIITRLHNSTGLEHFWFDNGRVGDAGLARLARFTRLKTLALRNTLVTDAGLAHVESLAQLELLALGGTQITSTGLIHVRGLSHLNELWLESTRVGDPGSFISNTFRS